MTTHLYCTYILLATVTPEPSNQESEMKSATYYALTIYFRAALLLGCHAHVFQLTSKWRKKKVKHPLFRAGLAVQPRLAALGYHKCPQCQWVTREFNEHINTPGSPCWEAMLPKCACCGILKEECDITQHYKEAERAERERREAETEAAWAEYYNESHQQEEIEEAEPTPDSHAHNGSGTPYYSSLSEEP